MTEGKSLFRIEMKASNSAFILKRIQCALQQCQMNKAKGLHITTYLDKERDSERERLALSYFQLFSQSISFHHFLWPVSVGPAYSLW